MLVLLGPGYEAREEEVLALVQATELTQYDLRARLCPGTWGVIKAFADEEQANELVLRLQQCGLPACAISNTVGQDVERRIVYLRAIQFEPDCVILRLSEREMAIPYGALLVIVRGEVHVGRSHNLSSSSGASSSIRPAASAVGLLSSGVGTGEYVREPRASAGQDVFSAADIHFATVPWIARIDAREMDFPREYGDVPNLAERLDRCVEDLAGQAQIRVDRALKTSSLASYTAGTQRSITPAPNGPSSVRRGSGPSDEHFDAYSRMVAEAERLILRRNLDSSRYRVSDLGET
jgi:hypothetical protein